VAAVAIATVAAFAAITVSLVQARRPLDRNVARSFAAVIPKHFGATAHARSNGCPKERLYFYRCSASVRPHKGRTSTVYWRLLLHDDGCWTALLALPVPPAAALGRAAPLVTTFVGCGA
jgi:hypothetical protein